MDEYCSAGLCVRAVLDKRSVLDVINVQVHGVRAYVTKKKDVLIE